MHVRVEAVCILANAAHKADDCVAVEKLISSKHKLETVAFSPAAWLELTHESTMECGHLVFFEMNRDILRPPPPPEPEKSDKSEILLRLKVTAL